MGWEGDYYTSSDISVLFTHCMGRQLQQMWEKLRHPDPFIVLEQGAGRGDLAAGIRQWAEQENPDLHAALDYRTEDIRFGQDVRGLDDNEPQTVVAPLAGAMSAGARSASVVLSNELVDAFPVHLVEVRDKHLYEVYIDVQHGHLSEVLDEPSTPEVAAYLDNFNIPWQTFGDHWRAEINLDALHWIERTAQLVQRGFILTIDYGEKARALYTRLRPRGTLACYYKHQLTERPLIRPGEQDITSHVNFSALINEGRRHGLRLHTFTTQRQWLEGCGIYEELERLRRERFAAADTERATDRGQVALLQWYTMRQRVMALTDPAGMGNFKVLILRR
jgi:SAM-dependent MidA family methyltransferase